MAGHSEAGSRRFRATAFEPTYVSTTSAGSLSIHARRFSTLNCSWRPPCRKDRSVQAYKVDQDLTYFLEGSGTIDTTSANRIVVTIDQPGNDGVTLKYHYVPGLKANDGSEIRPVFMMDDPRPFIKIKPRSPVFQIVL